MMKNLGLIWLMILSFQAFGTEIVSDDDVTRTITRSFHVKKSDQLEISNKYGQIVIGTWDEDSVKVRIDITAFGKTYSEARKTMERVDIDFERSGSYINIETVFDRSSNYFVELWNSLSDDTKALLSKSKIEVNYEVMVPKYLKLEIENKFGDLFMEDLTGSIDISLLHGNLRAGELSGKTYIDMGFGDIKVDKIKNARLNLKGVYAEIKEAGNLNITSSASEWWIKNVDDIKINSRSDRNIRIDHVDVIDGEVLFSSLKIGELDRRANIDFNFADLKIETVAWNFELIDLNLSASDVRLSLNTKSYLKVVDIEARENKLVVPLAFLELDKDILDEKKELIRLSGDIGAANSYPAVLKINSGNGDVDITWINEEQTVNK